MRKQDIQGVDCKNSDDDEVVTRVVAGIVGHTLCHSRSISTPSCFMRSVMVRTQLRTDVASFIFLGRESCL